MGNRDINGDLYIIGYSFTGWSMFIGPLMFFFGVLTISGWWFGTFGTFFYFS